jgi:hypothetical protein
VFYSLIAAQHQPRIDEVVEMPSRAEQSPA